jgi:osmotically-inducible protein OsmY
MFTSDAQLQRDVIDELRWDPTLLGNEIGVAVKGGVVTLSGKVNSLAKKFAAARAAESISGTKAVAESLTVALPLDGKRSDTEIAHGVVDALAWHVEVPTEKVKARVDDGWVFLEGEVEWQFQKSAAEFAVRYLTGVRGVSNLLTLKPHASAPDVKLHIERALKRHAELDAQDIRVETLDGTVTLKGTVVNRVQDQLTIRL